MNVAINELKEAEKYREILPDGVIEDTLARQQLINENKISAKSNLEKFRSSCNVMSDEIEGLGSSFTRNAQSYERLHNASSSNAKAYNSLGDQLRELAKELRQGQELFSNYFKK